MDFDEYEYLEKAVENPSKSNGVDSHKGSAEKERDRERRSSDSKRRRSGDDERERDRDSERRSKRSRSEEKEHRDRDRDRERERDKEKDRDRHHRDHRERDKDRDKDREREREKEKDKDREREKDRDKEKEREREKEKERERERERRSKSRHRDEDRDREKERYREKSRERENREKSRERDYRDRRKKDETAEPEADPERDQRTVFAYQLSLRADERDVYEFFSKAGKVRDVRLIMDRNSRRSKGVGYIEFYDVMSVPMAIALSGQLLLGQPVMVKPSEAEKNLVPSTATTGASASGGGRKVYVGNLHPNITEDQIRQVFESFGPVELVQLPHDQVTGLCKGFAFVQFAKMEDAKAALTLNGQLDIAGRTIKVSAVTDQPVQASTATSADLDDDEGGGLSLNASSRALLMAKLDRSGTTASLTTGIVGSTAATAGSVALPSASVLGAPPVIPNPLVANPLLQTTIPALAGLAKPGLLPNPTLAAAEAVAPPSECLLLKNMFDPSTETEPDFDLDIKEDVQDECSKYGPLKHIHVDKNSAGFVFLRFESVTAAMKAQSSLHGRWFAGKMITATYMTPQQYDAKFPGN
ncbi:hypothetical protein LUZ62_035740 [Rhynchospora pubera]|uniref:RRM domain-containing protein n=1 Tax=Rhynchospora pubera TaxID=906938 RepID=A0AAV8EYW2_9POAL|nr:hypothetical protein LUZ62_035740 [Rhynchospora pubera]